MKLLTGHDGILSVRQAPAAGLAFASTARAWDLWRPGQSSASAAIHELLFDSGVGHPPPAFAALVLAQAAMWPARSLSGGFAAGLSGALSSRALVWIDPGGTLYPPGLVAAGVPLDRLYILRPRRGDLIGAAVECLRCKSVAAVIATLPPRPSRVEVRRLQLAAERGGGVGILLRATEKGGSAGVYAAATRWLVWPAPGERTVQRWHVRLIHGHGGHLGQTFLLEKRRDSAQADLVHPPPPLADDPPISASAGSA